MPWPLAWLTVEAHHGPRFWEHVLGAVAAATAEHQVTAAPADGGEALDELVVLLRRPGPPVVVILDDLQELSVPRVWGELETLLSQAGDRLRLVIACRTDPALTLYRFRIRGALAELRNGTLGFTPRRDRADAQRARRPARRVGAGRAARGDAWLGGGTATRRPRRAGTPGARQPGAPLRVAGPGAGGVPRRRGLRHPAGGHPRGRPVHLGARPGQRGARGGADRAGRRRADPGAAGALEPVRRAGQRQRRHVPVPSALRSHALRRATPPPARTGPPAAPAGRGLVRRARPAGGRATARARRPQLGPGLRPARRELAGAGARGPAADHQGAGPAATAGGPQRSAAGPGVRGGAPGRQRPAGHGDVPAPGRPFPAHPRRVGPGGAAAHRRQLPHGRGAPVGQARADPGHGAAAAA